MSEGQEELRHDELRQAILSLLSRRAPEATICPSEAARLVGGDDAFRPLMPAARAAAAALVDEGRVEVTQGGSVVDPAAARGPIRIRLRRPPGGDLNGVKQ